ncbi:MAG: class I SAM-dependent methyltransferase [Nitrospirota bacterium]
MRVGMIPENPLEWLLTRANALPFPVADTFVAIIQARAIMAATRLGVFEALSKAPASAPELAAKLSCTDKGIQILLNALVGCGYVAESGGRYDLAPRARKWVTPDDPRSMNRFIDFQYDHWEWWMRLDDAIRTGATLDLHAGMLDPAGWRRYIYGLHDLSKMAARELVLRFRLRPNQTRLLDIGGGHGAYPAAYCRKYPNLHAVMFDLPPALDVAREIVQTHYRDVANRIELRPGDLAKDDLGSGHDVIFIFNLLHHFDGAEIRRIVQKVAGALNPGGAFVILDQFKREKGAGPESYAAVLTQLLFLVTSNAGSLDLGEVRAWLEESGFSNVRAKNLRVGPGTSYITAVKRA